MADEVSPAERAALDAWQRVSADTTGMLFAVRAALAVQRQEFAADPARLSAHATDEHANGWNEASAFLYGRASVASDDKAQAALWRAAEEMAAAARIVRNRATEGGDSHGE